MERKWRLLIGGVLYALMFFYLGACAYFHFVQPGSYTGWHGYSNDFHHFYTTDADPKGPTALLQKDDEILAINGVHPADDFSVLEWSDRVPPGTPFSMKALRNGQIIEIFARTTAFPPGKYPYDNWGRRLDLLTWFLFLFTGIFVLLLKPENRQAWLLALMLGTFVGIMTNNYPFGILGNLVAGLVTLAKIVALCFFVVFPVFFLNFPERSPLLTRFPRLEAWIGWSTLWLLLPNWIGGRLPLGLRQGYLKLPVVQLLGELEQRYNLPLIILAVYLALGLFFMFSSYHSANLEARKRMRVAMLGSSVGFVTLFLLVLNNLAWVKSLPGWASVMAFGLAIVPFALPLIPLSFAYAIIRHKVIPISLIIRRSVRYLFVSRGSTVLIALIVSGIVMFCLTLLFAYLQPSGMTIGLISATVGIAAWQLTWRLHRRFFAPVIDRWFFRQSYDSQQILTELSESLRTTTDTNHLLASVGEKLQSALQTASVTIFLRDEASGNYLNAYASKYDVANTRTITTPTTNRLPHFAATLTHLDQTGNPLDLDGSVPGYDLTATNGNSLFATEERETLLVAKAALLLPLKTKDALAGVIALGSRLGEVPFSSDDKRLLQSVGASASLALENAQLVERMIAEAHRRQEIEAENEARARELEEARQLQLSMLPRHVPQLPHVEIAAYMKTATQVGGDYYDFHLASDGTLTIAVGDATGHGLKAGTVVTATKGLFSHLAEQDDLIATLTQTSCSLKRMNMRGMFMALTLVKLRGTHMRYSAAGMPSILIYHAATQQIEELALRGAPLGGITSYVYRQADLTLAHNDIIVILSDGLPERFNRDGDMFGEERITDLLRQNAHQTPQMMIEQFVKVSDEWAEGRAADDDMTFVVLRFT